MGEVCAVGEACAVSEAVAARDGGAVDKVCAVGDVLPYCRTAALVYETPYSRCTVALQTCMCTCNRVLAVLLEGWPAWVLQQASMSLCRLLPWGELGGRCNALPYCQTAAFGEKCVRRRTGVHLACRRVTCNMVLAALYLRGLTVVILFLRIAGWHTPLCCWVGNRLCCWVARLGIQASIPSSLSLC